MAGARPGRPGRLRDGAGTAPIRALQAIAGRQVLLLFLRGSSTSPTLTPGGTIPGHDGSGPLHLGFSIDRSELPAWERRLAQHGIPLESRVEWPGGGSSLYLRDPDGHLAELLTPGVWEIY